MHRRCAFQRFVRSVFLVQLDFVGLQAAVTLLDINMTAENGVVGIIAFGLIRIDRHR